MAQISQRLQIIAVVIHILTFLFLTTAAGLFGNGYRRFNNDQIGNISVCFLFNKLQDFTSNSSGNSICVFSMVGEILSALGLIPLIIINIVKFVRRLVGWVFKLINKMKEVILFSEINSSLLCKFWSCCSLVHLL